jgi:hypothetical protein
MRIDLELRLAILLKLDAAGPGGLDEFSDLPPWPPAEVVACCQALKDEGLIVGQDESMSDGDWAFRLDRLTRAGRSLLAKLRRVGG